MAPFSCFYFVTYRCNSRCEYCFFWRDPELRDVGYARYLDAERNLRDLKTIGVRFVDFTGGEPLLNPELPQILEAAKAQGFFVKLSTNGLLYPEKADELKGLANRIYFSLDTTSASEYERIRGVDGFDKVVESIDIAKQMHQDVCLLYTVTNDTIKNMPDLLQFCRQHRVMMYVHPCFSYFGNQALSKDNALVLRRYFWKPYVRMSLPHLMFHVNGGNSLQHPRCRAGYSSFDITPDNAVAFPCFQRRKGMLSLEGGLASLFQSPAWKEAFAMAGRYPFCAHCTIDCNFGLSFWGRGPEDLPLQMLTYMKNFLVYHIR